MDPRGITPDAWAASRARSAAFARVWEGAPDRLGFIDAFDTVAASSLAVARDRAVALLADRDLARRLVAAMATALAADPLFDPPLRTTRDTGHLGAILFDTPAARMSAMLVSADGLTRRRRGHAVLPGHVTVTRYVRAGGAQIRRWRAEPDGGRLAEMTPLFPIDGDVVVHDGRSEAQAIDRADGDVALLSILLRAGAAPVVREYRRDDGTLLRTASTDDAASRTAMLLTLLRVSGRRDAADVFAAATHDPAPHARWAAMREWLALDAAAATPRLRVLADADPAAEVRAAAAATLALLHRRGLACHG